MAEQDHKQQAASAPARMSSRGLVAFLGGLIGAGCLLGVLAFHRYSESEVAMRDLYAQAQHTGETGDGEQCVLWAIGSPKNCAAMASLCDAAVPRLVEICLHAQDRAGFCTEQAPKDDTHWTLSRCQAHGFDRRNKTCEVAYLAAAAYCRELGEARKGE